jgi:ATP-dependent DNA helicase RecQ
MCLGELDYINDGLVMAQKILSCILRLDQRFGADYTALVLSGSQDRRIMDNNHDKLSTYNLLQNYPKSTIHDWIEQLTGQDYIEKTGEYNTLTVTQKGWKVLKGQETPRLLKPTERPAKVSKVATDSWEGVDRGLFGALRKLRAQIAGQNNVPAFIVFGDAALRDMARRKPATLETLLEVKGIGEKKCKQYGQVVLATIREYCQENGVEVQGR